VTSFFAALRFLTVLPVPGCWCGGEEALKRSVPFFAVVGLCIGGLAAGMDAAFIRILPPLPVAVLVVIFLMAASGGLHVDGLADTADGFFSSRSRERMLEIMQDSRTGPMGTAAVACVWCEGSRWPPFPFADVGAVLLMPAGSVRHRGRHGRPSVCPHGRGLRRSRGRRSGGGVGAGDLLARRLVGVGLDGAGTVAASVVAVLLFASYAAARSAASRATRWAPSAKSSKSFRRWRSGPMA
jgi:hypothetical protein